MMIAIIIVLVIAILAVAAFFAFNMMNKDATQDTGDKMEETSDISSKDIEELNNEVEGITLTDPDSDLMEVDQQINSIDASATPSAKPVDR